MFERLTTLDSQLILKNQLTNNTTTASLNNIYKKSNTIFLRQSHVMDQVIAPLNEHRKKVFDLEKQLYESLNLQWDIDIVTEDIPIIDNVHDDYYMHLLRTAHPDPNKENFLLIHGFLSSNLHFLGILPYLIKR